jgi:eukaryotic-like serine/threonine-protein kinase
VKPGTRVGAFEVVAPLGRGGMGEVYRAHDTRLGRDVALKIIPDLFADDPERRARFDREAKTLAALNHPLIAQIHGVEESDGVRALVMELVEGEDLSQRIARGPLPVDECLTIARQLAEALQAAHEQGIVHRDLKPANIKLRPDGTIKVLDFGLAKAVEQGPHSGASPSVMLNSPTITTPAMTAQGLVLGTAAYMAPEQAKGRPADRRADIWAFGCVIYETLTGRRAFDGEDVSETLASILRSEPDWTALPQEVAPAVRTLLRRCLERDRQARIAHASTILFVLAEHDRLVGDGQRASDADRETAAAVAQVRRSLLRRTVAGAAVVVVLVAVTAAALWNPRPAPGPVARFSVPLTQDLRWTLVNRGIVAIADDGSRFAWRGAGGIYLRALSSDAPQLLVSDPLGTAVHTLAFSPDGAAIAFVQGNELKRVPTAGGAPATLCQVGSVFGMSWNDRGIFVAQGARGVARCPPNGGALEQLVTAAEGEEFQGPQLLPDGDGLLLTVAKVSEGTARWDKAQVVVHSLRTGARQPVLSGGSDAKYVATGHLLYAYQGVLFAVPFDHKTRQTLGPPVSVLEGVYRGTGGIAGAAHYTVSRNGSLVYLPGAAWLTSEYAIAVADRAGALQRLPLAPATYAQVRAAPDGKRLAIATDDGAEAIIWTYELGGTAAMQRLTLQGRNRFPVWSPSGEQIAFQSDREGDAAIYVQDIGGGAPAERVSRPGEGEVHVPESWSPDGRLLAFTVQKASQFTLWTLQFPTKTTRPFGAVVSAEPLSATFSPDGRWMLYTSSPGSGGGASPNRGVFLQAIDSAATVYQVPKQALDFHPTWARGGAEIVFVPSAISGQMAVVPLATRPRVTFGAATLLPARVTGDRTSSLYRAYDVLPDGRFVGLVNAGLSTDAPSGRPGEIRVVLNWFEELKQRVPSP